MMKLEPWVCCEVWGFLNSDYKIAGMWHDIICAETTETVILQTLVFSNRIDWSGFQTCIQRDFSWIDSKKTNKCNAQCSMLTSIHDCGKSASFLNGSPTGNKSVKRRQYATLWTRNQICNCVEHWNTLPFVVSLKNYNFELKCEIVCKILNS
jgi:hypothetical protein